jgi:hypothetical protein
VMKTGDVHKTFACLKQAIECFHVCKVCVYLTTRP